jgi:predicted  nucleic acid-binding Zn-ribbon protein
MAVPRRFQFLMDDLTMVQQQIRAAEAEIKAIQSQISHVRAKRVNLGRAPRRPTFVRIPEDQIESLAKLSFEISTKRRTRAEIDSQNADLQSAVASQLADIGAAERAIEALPDQLVRAIGSRVASQSNQVVVSRDLAERRLEVKTIKRLYKDAATTLTAVSLRRDVSSLDRPDLRPLRDQIRHLESEIRRVRKRLRKLIRLEEIELAARLKRTDDEIAIISALNDPEAEALEFDVLAMTQELKVKRKEPRDVQDLVQAAHALSLSTRAA